MRSELAYFLIGSEQREYHVTECVPEDAYLGTLKYFAMHVD
jgi:hypothetical protein